MQFKQKIIAFCIFLVITLVLLVSGAISSFMKSWDLSHSLYAFKLRNSDIHQRLQYVEPLEKPTWRSKTSLKTKTNCAEHYKLILLVTSAPENYERRIGIRRTWAKSWHERVGLPKWKTMFLIGQSNNRATRGKILEENTRFGDLVLGDFQESFYNLSIKIIMGFEWATQYCQNFEYIFKSDDDVFINMENLFRFINQTDIPKTGLYAGNIHYQSPPERSGRYEVSEVEYPYDYYPRYASGGGFVVSKDVAAMMVASHDTANYLKIDDAYIGMLALANGIDARHDDKFKGVRIVKNVCNCNEKMILIHGASTIHCMTKLYYCKILPPGMNR